MSESFLDSSANSPGENSSDDSLITVGRILGAHGRDGEIRVRSTSDVPDRFDEGKILMVSRDGVVAEEQTYRIARSRSTVSKGSVELIIAFHDFYDRALAMSLAG